MSNIQGPSMVRRTLRRRITYYRLTIADRTKRGLACDRAEGEVAATIVLLLAYAKKKPVVEESLGEYRPMTNEMACSIIETQIAYLIRTIPELEAQGRPVGYQRVELAALTAAMDWMEALAEATETVSSVAT